jgi:tetratricopeptide (TPR) repeat protein
MKKLRRVLAVALVSIAMVALGGDGSAQQAPPSMQMTALEDEAYRLLKENKLITARTKAEEALARNENSIVANYVLGAVLHESEGDLGRAMYRLGRARQIFEKTYGSSPGQNTPWLMHREILFQTQLLAGQMEEYRYQLEILDFYDALYEPHLVAEHAWPLLRLGKYDAARDIARKAIASGDRAQKSRGRNALCAIEGEARQRAAYFRACSEALEGAKKELTPASAGAAPGENAAALVVHQYNAALAAYSALRFDEVERLAKEGSEAKPTTVANPWRILARLYTDGGRSAEAVQAAREMQSWRARQGASLRDQDRAETDATLAALLLLAGEAESAERLIERAIQHPDRRGLVSSKADQAMGAHALLRRSVLRTRAELHAERASVSGTKDRVTKTASAISTRVGSWGDDERVASVLSDRGRLDSTVRMYLRGGIEPVPSWLLPDVVDVLGPGIVAVAVEKARAEENEIPGLRAYYDALDAHVAFARGDHKEAVGLARKARAALPKSEAMLAARLAAVGAEASRRSGDHAGAMALFEETLQQDPGVLRRLGLALPARVVVNGGSDKATDRAVVLLHRSPRLREDERGFVVAVERADGALRACLRSPTGTTLVCAVAPKKEKEKDKPEEDAEGWGARLVDLFHRQAFAMKVSLTAVDLKSLDGSTTVASQAQREQMNDVLKGLAED